jgi:hypothetical protein
MALEQLTTSPVPGVALKTTTANNIDMRYAGAGGVRWFCSAMAGRRAGTRGGTSSRR